MKREEAKALVASLVALRESATDEQALQAVGVYPAWREGVAYAEGQRVRHHGELYRVLTPHESQATWTPDAAPSLFARVLTADDGTILAWQQPDSTNGYKAGDKVTHNGKTWESTTDGNVWEPGAVGTESLWSEVSG
jgi:chitodextrinase